jgi:hypothetical protein
MDHNEAVHQMTVERYLLDELTPEARDAFEEHMFDCSACAEDVRTASAFVDEAKLQLPALTENLPASPSTGSVRTRRTRNHWLSWWRPVFVMPVFAALLVVVSYQNLVTLPEMSKAANQPRLLAWVPMHGSVRGGGALPVTADREHGVAFPIDLFQPPTGAAYVSFAFVLVDPEGKPIWTGSTSAPANDAQISLAIPGAILRTGTYTVSVNGIGPQGQSTPVGRYAFDLHLTN